MGQRRDITDDPVTPELIREVLKLDLQEHEKKAAEALLANGNHRLSPQELHRMGFKRPCDFLYFNTTLRNSGLPVVFRSAERGQSAEKSHRFFCVRPGAIQLPAWHPEKSYGAAK
jgi:hypothetical protein